jgi:hypothetical protein
VKAINLAGERNFPWKARTPSFFKFGIAYDIGEYVDGLRGTLEGINGRKSFGLGCIDSSQGEADFVWKDFENGPYLVPNPL